MSITKNFSDYTLAVYTVYMTCSLITSVHTFIIQDINRINQILLRCICPKSFQSHFRWQSGIFSSLYLMGWLLLMFVFSELHINKGVGGEEGKFFLPLSLALCLEELCKIVFFLPCKDLAQKGCGGGTDTVRFLITFPHP